MTTRTMPPAAGTVGVFHGIDIEDYHQGEGVSNSALIDFRHSPFVYWAKRFDPERPAEKDRTGHIEGNLLHCAFLEPHAFGDRYVTVPETAPKKPSITQLNAKKPAPDTLIAIDWWDNFVVEHAGKLTVSPEQYTVAWKQADSLRKIRALAECTEQGAAEVSAYAIDPGTGLYLKARPDWVRPWGDSGVMLLDAKTTKDASTYEFGRTIAKKQYHRQAALHSDVYEMASQKSILGYLWGAVESEWPFLAKAYEMGPLTRAQGRAEYQTDLRALAACKRDAAWRASDDTIEPLEIPGYALTEKP